MADLIGAARSGRLVIFAGAGISMIPPTNLPSWRDVNRLVIHSLGDSAGKRIGGEKAAGAVQALLARHEQERLPPEFQAQLLADLLGNHYFEVLRHLDSNQPNAVHLALAALARAGAVRAIITTNFDRAIEAAFQTAGIPLERRYSAAHFTALAGELERFEQRGMECQLLKLHGSVDEAATLIDTLAQRKRGFPVDVLGCIRRLLHWGHWAFLGFSGLDLEAEPNYLSLVQESETAAGFTWLVRTGTEPRAPVLRLKELYGERAEVVSGDLPAWILELTKTVSPEAIGWIERTLASAPPAQENSLDALSRGAVAWAERLAPDVCSLALARLLEAAAEPQASVEILRVLLQTKEPPAGGIELADLYVREVAANSLGCSLGRMGRHEEAVGYLKEAAGIMKQVGDEDARDRCLRNLAWNLEALGESQSASELYEAVLAGVRSRNDDRQLAVALADLSRFLIAQGDYERARALAQEALPHAAVAGDEEQRITALNNLGIVAQRLEQYEEALKYYAECEQVCRRLGAEGNLANVLGSQGDTLALMGRVDEAEALYQTVLELSGRLELRANTAETFLSLGILAQKRQDFEGALARYESALGLFGEVRNPAKEAEALFRITSLQLELGRWQQALASGQAALAKAEVHSRPLAGYILLQAGRALCGLQRLKEAVEAFRQCEEVAASAEDSYLRANAAENRAATLLLLQRDDEAAAAYSAAAGLWKQQNNAGQFARAQYGLAAVRLDQVLGALSDAGHAFPGAADRTDAARCMVELYPALVAMYRRLGANGLAGQFLLSAGSTCGFLSEPGRAIEHYREAAREFGSAGPPTGRAEALRRLEPLLHDKTNAMLSDGHLNEAIPWLIELADTAGELGHGQLRATSQINAAIAMLHTTEQIAEALALAEAAFAECLPESGEAQRAARTIELCRQRLSTGVLAPGREVS